MRAETEKPPRRAASLIVPELQLKIAPTVSSKVNVTWQLFGPAAVTGRSGVQLYDHPPNAPAPAGAVRITVVPTGYVATHTDPLRPAPLEPAPQCSTLGVPVAEGAVTSQLVVFRPSL